MTSHPRVPLPDDLAVLAESLGLTDIEYFERDAGTSPLIHARWNGAPVALSQRTGMAGGIGIAFYRGPVPAGPCQHCPGCALDEEYPTCTGCATCDSWRMGEWDEVLDTTWRDPQALLLIAGAVLGARAAERAADYAGIPWPDAPAATEEPA